MRSFKPTGHRHTAEIIQELTFDGNVAGSRLLGDLDRGGARHPGDFARLSERADVGQGDLGDLPRGVQGRAVHADRQGERAAFTAIRNRKSSPARNYCDVGFERDPHSNRVVVMAALDNLMKGAAGQAVQSFNIRLGFEEDCGIDFAGLHPI